MISYSEIIEEQRKKLDTNISWWPLYLYHFTDVLNAVNIIDKEYIYGRKTAIERHLMSTDNASANVINMTQDDVLRYARLYMRPKTPTQYHNEGYKPKHIRNKEIDANCPVPIFFFLDAEKTLSMDGMKFIEKGLARGIHDDNEFLNGETEFLKLNFEKIFHVGPFDKSSDITKYRHTEVIREDGIPISKVIKGIACRSIAEKQTLLYLLKKTSEERYNRYRNIISYKPELDIFYKNGVYIKDVYFKDDKFHFNLNDKSIRSHISKSNGEDFKVEIRIDCLGEKNEVLDSNMGSKMIDYSKITKLNYKVRRKPLSNKVLIEVKFDDRLMYNNIIHINDFKIV